MSVFYPQGLPTVWRTIGESSARSMLIYFRKVGLNLLELLKCHTGHICISFYNFFPSRFQTKNRVLSGQYNQVQPSALELYMQKFLQKENLLPTPVVINSSLHTSMMMEPEDMCKPTINLVRQKRSSQQLNQELTAADSEQDMRYERVHQIDHCHDSQPFFGLQLNQYQDHVNDDLKVLADLWSNSPIPPPTRPRRTQHMHHVVNVGEAVSGLSTIFDKASQELTYGVSAAGISDSGRIQSHNPIPSAPSGSRTLDACPQPVLRNELLDDYFELSTYPYTDTYSCKIEEMFLIPNISPYLGWGS